jgi:DNA-binding response OmpR family regulator
MSVPKVLVVEADPGIRKLFDDVLCSEGYCVELMERRAVSPCRIAAARPDLLLLELMPGTADQTLALIAEVRGQASAATPILVSTTDPLLVQRHGQELHQLGCATLLKPFDLDELVETVSQHIAATA